MFQRKYYFLSVFVMFFSFLITTGVSQTRTGNVYGTTVDEAGDPLPGVSVILTSDLIGQMTFISTEKGNFRFLSLSPGTYTLRAELQGFSPAIRENVIVRTGVNVTVEIKLVPETLKETITVTASAPTIDTKKTDRSLNMNSDDLQNIPTARDPWVIMEMAPGVVMDRENVGGSESGHQSRFVGRGTGKEGANWSLDGIDTTDQSAEGSSSLYYDFDSFEEIQIQTAAADVTAFTPGAQVNMVTKRGGNRLNGGGRFYISDKSFQADNKPEGVVDESAISKVLDYGLNLGGPIFKDKLWFWAGYGAQRVQEEAMGTTDKMKADVYNYELKLNAALGRHRIETFINVQDNPMYGRIASSPLDDFSVRYEQKGPCPIFKLQDEITFSNNFFISLQGSYMGFAFDLIPIGGLNKVSIWDMATSTYKLTYYYGTEYNRPQYFYQAQGYFYTEKLFGLNHEFKFGTEFKHSIVGQHRPYSQRLYYRDYAAKISYRAYIYRDADRDSAVDRFSAYLQDTVSFGRFTLIAAARYDRQWGYLNELSVPGTNIDWAGKYNLPSVTVKAKDGNVIWNTISPRLGLVYDIFGTGRTIAKLNFGLYADRYASGFIGDLANTAGNVRFTWTDLNRDERVQANEVKSPVTLDSFFQGDPDYLFDPGLKSPKTMEITAGIEHELFEDFGAGVTFVYRKNYNQYWEVPYVIEGGTERLLRSSDWIVGGTMPGEWGGYTWWQWKPGLKESAFGYTTQRPDYYERYLGVELSFKKRFSTKSRWLIDGSVTLQDWKRFYPSRESYTDPTDHEPVDLVGGRLTEYISGSSSGVKVCMNPRWMAKLGFSAEVPFGINLGASAVFREGYILPKYYVDYDNETNGTEDNPQTLIAPYGTYRLDPYIMMNLRAEKSIRFANRASVTLTFDLFNITNTNVTLDEIYEVSASNYQEVKFYTKPRIFRLGVRFRF